VAKGDEEEEKEKKKESVPVRLLTKPKRFFYVLSIC
jgi:hypothetical protein